MYECNICHSSVEIIPFNKNFISVTSDGRICDFLGDISICLECGHVQKVLTTDWKQEVEHLYKTYQTHPIEGSQDQMLYFDDKIKPRFIAILERLVALIPFSNKGKMLDIGCAQGTFLQYAHKFFKNWELFGHEYNEHFKNQVISNKYVKGFTSGCLANIKNKFDLISLQHVLEHVVEPEKSLKEQVNLLNDNAIHFMQTPCFIDDPFDLLVMDHCSHFTPQTLSSLASKCGLKIIDTTNGWTQKHHGWVSIKQKNLYDNYIHISKEDIKNIKNILVSSLQWIDNLSSFIKQYAGVKELGILGTAQAGTWIAAMLGDRVSFFVDEDEKHQGKEHLGLPIYSPLNIPKNAYVFLSFSPNIASNIKKRLDIKYKKLFFFAPKSI